MNRPARSIEIFTMSALDLFITAMGSFAILMMILFPYYRAEKMAEAARKEQREREKAEADKTGDADAIGMATGDVLMCIWPTRLQDYQQFVEESGYQGFDPKRPYSSTDLMRGEPWRDPGFAQEPTHPVVGVSWVDARAFCAWLTKKERAAGTIGPQDYYRLPSDEEWSAAAGAEKYPWGNDWPPPPGAGNFAGAEYQASLGYTAPGGYRDDYPFTAPVGRFAANRLGIHDLAGNVGEWCLDFFRSEMNPPDLRAAMPALQQEVPARTRRVLRGSHWQTGYEGRLRTAFRDSLRPTLRWEASGFRCVLVIVKPLP